MSHSPAPPRRCIVSGGSAGLGYSIAAALLQRGDQVTICGRDPERLAAAAQRLEQSTNHRPHVFAADVVNRSAADDLVANAVEQFGGLDVVVNVVGQSDRGYIDALELQHLDQLFRTNVHSALNVSVAARDELQRSGGVVVNIGSLAGKVGSRFIGGYAIAKHALAGMTQQLRLEWKPRGIHVGLVNPGPIRREDAGHRYQIPGVQSASQPASSPSGALQPTENQPVPASAAEPGGGAKLRGLEPSVVADAVLTMIDHRSPDIVLPGYLRYVFAIGHLMPRLGDWLLLKFTKS